MVAAVVDLAELAGGHRLLAGDVPGVVDHHVVDGERELLRLRKLVELLRVRNRGRNRLLDDHVLAGLERGHGERHVAAVVRRDVDAIDRLVGENLIQRGIPLEAQRLRRRLTRGIEVRRARQHRVLQRLEALLVAGIAFLRHTILGNAAESHQHVFDLRHLRHSLFELNRCRHYTKNTATSDVGLPRISALEVVSPPDKYLVDPLHHFLVLHGLEDAPAFGSPLSRPAVL